jgi:hypothetical protein
MPTGTKQHYALHSAHRLATRLQGQHLPPHCC